MSRSTSRSVRYSRLRLPTVTFTEVGADFRSRDFSMEIALPPVHTVTNLDGRVTESTRPDHRKRQGAALGQHLSVRRPPHVASALKPASATSLRYSASRGGENRPRKAAGCVFRRGRPQRTTRWRGCGQGCTRAGPREARKRITLFRWSGGRCSLDQLRCASFPVIWVEAMKTRSRGRRRTS
jgi:hypothetical protein